MSNTHLKINNYYLYNNFPVKILEIIDDMFTIKLLHKDEIVKFNLNFVLENFHYINLENELIYCLGFKENREKSQQINEDTGLYIKVYIKTSGYYILKLICDNNLPKEDKYIHKNIIIDSGICTEVMSGLKDNYQQIFSNQNILFVTIGDLILKLKSIEDSVDYDKLILDFYQNY